MKRHETLQPLSREHHHSLLLCWKIRTGLSNGTKPQRIKKYVDWFVENHIIPHFNAEEAYIFPILGMDHGMTKRAMAEHRRLKRLFKDKEEIVKSLSLIEEELEGHIRYEERVVFPEIQEIATEDQLELISTLHKESSFIDNTTDEFWR